VLADQPYDIHACGLFWNAPVADQGATIVHELTHFYTVGGTADVAYGANACRQLADGAPDEATGNADSYAYFAAPH
jgi:peptidyl-Lys metalloendopeptidase